MAKANVLLRLTKGAGSDWQQLLQRELNLASHKEAQSGCGLHKWLHQLAESAAATSLRDQLVMSIE